MRNVKLSIILLVMLLLSGCVTATYTDGKGRKLTVTSGIFNTKIGKVTAITGDGDSLTMENYDAESQALELARDVVGKLPVPMATVPALSPAPAPENPI